MRNYDFSRFYGAYIRTMRKAFGISQKEMAKIGGMSNTSLSKIEQGERIMTKSTFRQCIAYFEEKESSYRFSEEIAQIEEAEHWIEVCVQRFLDTTYCTNLDDVKQRLREKERSHSFAFFHWRLLALFLQVMHDEDCEDELRELLAIGWFQESAHQSLLYDLLGVSKDPASVKTLQDQIRALQKARSLAWDAHCAPLIALTDYHLVWKHSRYQRTKAFLYFEEGEKFLNRTGAINRLLHFKLNQGILYRRLQMNELALSVFRSLLESSPSISNPDLKQRILENLAWSEFVLEHFESAIQTARQAIVHHNEFPDLAIVLVMSPFHQKKLDKARIELERFLAKPVLDERSALIHDFLELVQKIMRDEPGIAPFATRIESRCASFRDVELEDSLYWILSEYYESKADYKTALHYAKKRSLYLKAAFFADDAS